MGIFDILELIGALSLFLFGMKVMSEALLELGGNRMRAVLAGLTSNRFKGVGTGFLITAVIQSSSATTLMVVSFANAALLTLPQAFSVIMGANIGTTITAWLITLVGIKVSMGAIALPVIGFGFALVISKKEKWQELGNFVVGFGLLFLGLELLRTNLPDLSLYPETLDFIKHYTKFGFWSVLLFLFIGTLLTVILQSSSATMALTLIIASAGWLPFELAAALVLGENIGTTITANLAAVVGNFRARQTAMAHLIFNIFGILWMLIALGPFLNFIDWLVVEMGGKSPLRHSGDLPLAISLFHTGFNVANSLILIGLVYPISRFIQRIIPEQVLPEKAIEEPKYLTDQALAYPQTVLAALENESRYLYEHAIFEIIAHSIHLHRADIISDKKAGKVVSESRMDLKTDVRELYLTKVKRIYSLIIAYATKAQSSLHLSEEQHRRISELKQANRRMVEMIRYATDLNRNVSHYLNGSNSVMFGQYDLFRKRMVKVLRGLDQLRNSANTQENKILLFGLQDYAQKQANADNLKIDALIRDEVISPEMATSLLNDSDNVTLLIDNLLRVNSFLYEV